MAKPKTRVTMTDIAHASGFSLSTVSLALNNKPGLPDETRAKVLETAQQLGYIARKSPYRPAGKILSRNIALVVGRIHSDDPPASPLPGFAAAELLVGVEDACREESLALHYITCAAAEGPGAQVITALVEEHNLAGLLLAGVCLSSELRHALRRMKLPVVLIEPGEQAGGFDTLAVDHFAGAFAATRHLIEKGHRRIACLGWQPEQPSIPPDGRQAALYGYQQALAVYGLSENACVVSPADEGAVELLLVEHPQITAVFASRPGAAIPALRGALAAGRRVPDDLSIVAVDGSALAENAIPPLTTIEAGWDDLGRLAVRTLLNRAANLGQSCITTYLQPRLVEHRSVTGCSQPVEPR